MRVMSRLGEDPLNNALGQLSGALVLLLHNTHAHAGLNLGSTLTIHTLIMVKTIRE